MRNEINVSTLMSYIGSRYQLYSIDNTDFIVDLHLKLKKEIHIKSVIKQGFVNNKAILYLQIKNGIDVLYIYYINEIKELNIENSYNSRITQKE